MAERLELSRDEIDAMGQAVLRWAGEYYEGLRERPALVPTTSEALRRLLGGPLPVEGADMGSILRTVNDVVAGFSRHNGHPRFFGYISSPGTAIGAMAGMISAALNINVTCWRSSPAATELEHLTIGWLKEAIGYPAEAAGLLVSGGSMANFAALAAARSAKAGADVLRDGVAAAGRAMRVYVSEEGHFSIRKAAGMLGIGEANVRTIGVDERLRVDVGELQRRVEEDLRAGHLPFCVVGNAGTTATGAVDPIGELAEVARKYGMWLHVDAAYGGFAALAPSGKALLGDLGRADSVALDPHKWLYLSVGCGGVLYRDGAAARMAFAHGAEYTKPIGLERDEAFAFWDYGPELSRPFRALELWMVIQFVGARQIGAAIEENMACARYFEELVKASEDFEMLAPVGLSVFCFRYAPKGFAGDMDELNERVLVRVQREGHSYLSNARVRGRFALRGCVLNYRTSRRDMEILLEDVRRAGG